MKTFKYIFGILVASVAMADGTTFVPGKAICYEVSGGSQRIMRIYQAVDSTVLKEERDAIFGDGGNPSPSASYFLNTYCDLTKNWTITDMSFVGCCIKN